LINLSGLSLKTLDAVLTGGSFSIKSEDELLERLLSLGEEYRLLLRWVEMRFLSGSWLAALAEYLGSPAEWGWGGIADHLIAPLPLTPVLDSAIISDFPEIFAEFSGKRFSLLLRGSRDGFAAGDFHSRCDGHANTLTVILDTNGNVLGGFTRRSGSRWCGTRSGRTCASRCESEEFSFHAEESAQRPGAEICVKGRRK
jgi:hypothetical protein